jgi:hypothetical protein
MAQQAQGAQRGSSNTLGLAGFIVSLVGVVLTCGALCPIGLILSAIGLRRPQQRGYAVAGVIIGIVGTAELVIVAIVGFHTVTTCVGIGKAVARDLGTLATGDEATQAIEAYRQAHDGELPDSEEGQALVSKYKDEWGTTLRYTRADDDYEVMSAGPDRRFETEDDIDCRALSVMRQHMTTMATVGKAMEDIEAYRQKHDGEPPDSEEGQALTAKYKDEWGTALRYKRTEYGWEAISAGPDRKFETEDDISIPGLGPIPWRQLLPNLLPQKR